ncbi:MAG: HAMP domain-containing sensor histidine kinase [Cyanobacteriota bacterium]|nr:HAMP domain-containing sensor histidine kinase [Cyanobacteriota bacterium]
MFQATRRRLALWYAGVTALLLMVFATGVYWYVLNTLIDRVDDTLKHVVEVVERSLLQPQLPGVETRFRYNVEAVEGDRIDLEWFGPDGTLLGSTFSEPLNIPLHLHPARTTIRTAKEDLLRQVTQKIEVDGRVIGYLRVSHPWFEVTKPIRQLIVDLSAATTVMVGCVAGIGWWLSGIAIQPVRDSYQSLKQFTADASHELRNPIATIQTNVQTALAYPDAEPQLLQRQLLAIERLTRRLGRLVNDLLFLTRSDSGMLEIEEQSLPLDALLIEAIEEQRVVAQQQGIYLSLRIIEPEGKDLELGEEVFATKGDWDRLARLFTNLIGNAIEYASPMGENNVSSLSSLDAGSGEEPSQEAAVEVELQRKPRDRVAGLEVQVRDTGAGIAESALPHLFDRFYRVDPSRARDRVGSDSMGTGLGLAIARAIVEHHQGRIAVSSVVNQGTTFSVWLPAARSDLA